ncbi:SNF2-family ATP dependent chromatin remodeling factor snf21 [Lactarius indigo]|nr:SNF2-family ATP dependent chromatin remodeling factor snf21 [Lactarius indigo]
MAVSSASPSPSFAMTPGPPSSTAPSTPPIVESDPDEEARYTNMQALLDKFMDRSREKHASVAATALSRTPKPKQKQRAGRSGRHLSGGKKPSPEARPDSSKRSETAFVQPALLTGAKLKDYQLEGVAWMVSLWENGISGILGKMGLGKTIQTIAFIAHLRVRVEAPFLVVCPLSVLHNWIDEFTRFAPEIPVCMYHGSPDERAELRRTSMAFTQRGRKKRRPTKHRDTDSDEEDEEVEVVTDDEDLTTQKSSFPVVITTYEMIIKDRKHLARYDWGQVIVDEGHRLKNMDSILMREIKKYPSAGRLLLTGTPLHNNLAELWSLLNFILPEIFDDVAAFQDSFKIPTLSNGLAESRNTVLIHKLHEILRPFLLRRLKVDVERSLPPKKEYVLYAPLTERQREVYDAVTQGNANIKRIAREIEEDEKLGRVGTRTRKSRVGLTPTTADIGAEHQLKAKMKEINNMHLQNVVMQLRKVCSHPILFEGPRMHQHVMDDELVLVFSQFVTMLDVIEDWAHECKGWQLPAGRRAEMDRFQQGGDAPDAPRLFLLSTRAGGLGINLTAADTVVFYDQDWNPQIDLQAQDRAHRIGQTRPVLIFRLVSRHTIESKILQRASEKRQLEALVIAKGKFKAPIGSNAKTETRQTIAEMAAHLLELEGEHIEVVPSTAAGKRSVISDAELDMLLDRRKEVFEGRGVGWGAETPRRRRADADSGLFEVYEAPMDEGNDALAHMLGEDVSASL